MHLRLFSTYKLISRLRAHALVAAMLLSLLCAATLPALADGMEETFPALRNSADPGMQAALESLVKDQGLWQAVSSDKLALAIVDVSEPGYPRLAMLNGDDMVYAASLPKIAILLGAFAEAEAGELELDDQLYSDMTAMIRHSSNHSATRVLERVGRQDLLDILQSPRYRLYDPEYNGGLWVGKAYAKHGAYKRDPLYNLSHGATAFQVARFYYLLATERLVSPELCQQMKEIMSKPGIEHKFVKGLKSRPGVEIYRKSGTWRNYHADSALVEYGAHKYIIVGLAQDGRGGQWLADLAAPLHDMIAGEQVASHP